MECNRVRHVIQMKMMTMVLCNCAFIIWQLIWHNLNGGWSFNLTHHPSNFSLIKSNQLFSSHHHHPRWRMIMEWAYARKIFYILFLNILRLASIKAASNCDPTVDNTLYIPTSTVQLNTKQIWTKFRIRMEAFSLYLKMPAKINVSNNACVWM